MCFGVFGGPDNLLSGWPKATGSEGFNPATDANGQDQLRFLCALRTRTTSCPGHRLSDGLSRWKAWLLPKSSVILSGDEPCRYL